MMPRKPSRLRLQAAERALAELEGAPGAGGAPEPASGGAPVAPSDPRAAAELDAMRSMTELLADVPAAAWAPIPAPPLSDASPARAPDRRRRVRLTAAVATAAAVVCLGIGFAVGYLVQGGNGGSGSTQASAPSVVLYPLASGGSSRAVAYMPGGDQMLLRVTHLPPSPPGTYYELWLMSNVHHLTPVTAFQIGSGGMARLALRLPDRSSRYLYLDISEQKIGGGAAHSADSVLRGRLT